MRCRVLPPHLNFIRKATVCLHSFIPICADRVTVGMVILMGRLDFLYRMDLPHRAKSVYIYLADRANKDGECWPAIPTIARELKLSQSTVRRALQDLRRAGLLETEQRFRKHGGKSSLLYSLKR